MRRSTILIVSLALGAFLCAPSWIDRSVAHAQPKRGAKTAPQKGDDKGGDKGKKLKVFDFTGLDVAGQLRAPQLLYFLDRANEELQRASLERRSFIPELVRSLDEESL